MKAIMITQADPYEAILQEVNDEALPEGNVTVAIDYSTLNYKDSLAITGHSPIIRSFPMVPGIDFAGTVIESSHANYKAGDKVILTGWGVGETHWGGLAEKARVKGDWLVPLPEGLTTKQAMAIGTAGFTAMLAVLALEKNGVMPEDGDIIVTGATGGVGSVAVSLLAKRGYRVVASTGRLEEADYLKVLGAAELLERSILSEKGRPLQKERWAGAIDAVGSHTLANICASTRRHGVVTACGLAQGHDLPTTVMPFILRGIRLIGIDSVYCPMEQRIKAWQQLAEELDVLLLERMTQEIALSAVIEMAKTQLAGQVRGRLVVDVHR